MLDIRNFLERKAEAFRDFASRTAQVIGDLAHNCFTSYPDGQLQTSFARCEFEKLRDDLRNHRISLTEARLPCADTPLDVPDDPKTWGKPRDQEDWGKLPDMKNWGKPESFMDKEG